MRTLAIIGAVGLGLAFTALVAGAARPPVKFTAGLPLVLACWTTPARPRVMARLTPKNLRGAAVRAVKRPRGCGTEGVVTVRNYLRGLGRKPLVLVIGGGVAAAVVAVGAYAYFSGQGTATGNAATGGPPALTVTVGSINGGNPVYPGDVVDVPIHVQNASGHASGVGLVKLDSVDAPAGCDPAWFTMPNLPGGGALADVTGRDYTGSLTFADTGSAQDACANASIVLHISAVPS